MLQLSWTDCRCPWEEWSIPAPCCYSSPSSLRHPLCFSGGIYRAAPDASTPLLCWSPTHASFRPGSLCSPLTLSFLLLLLPVDRRFSILPSLGVGRRLALCIPTCLVLSSCFLLYLLLPVCDHCASTWLHLLSVPPCSVCQHVCHLPALQHRSVSSWGAPASFAWSMRSCEIRTQKCQFELLQPFVATDCSLNPQPRSA